MIRRLMIEASLQQLSNPLKRHSKNFGSLTKRHTEIFGQKTAPLRSLHCRHARVSRSLR